MTSVLGIITARGGSKSIPKKNIRNLCGSPLIYYTIKSAHKSKLTRTILSTDSSEIAEISTSYNVEIPFLRPQELAYDNSTSIEVVQHAIEWLKENEKAEYDYVMILQPTSPLRLAHDINACIDIALETNADSVMSMVELDDFAPQKLKIITHDNRIRPLFESEGKISLQRQDGQAVFKRNAAIYLTKTKLIQKGDLFGENSYAYVMPQDRSVDINSPFDFELAEFVMRKNKYA